MRSISPVSMFHRYFPPAAAAYSLALWEQHRFSFKIARARRTRLGDYRFTPAQGHQITVNGNLNPYAFLFTYLHEVAHLITFARYGQRRRPKLLPHGPEWKQHFRELVQPVLNPEVFPAPLLAVITQHMRNPGATSASDPALVAAFRMYDPEQPANKVLLSGVQNGEIFRLNGRTFIKEQTRRTRALCRDTQTQRKYTVSEAAWVERSVPAAAE